MRRVPPSALLALCLCLSAAPARASFDWLGKIDAVADGLEARDPAARLEAVRRLATFDIRWTKGHLMRALADGDPEVRRAAGSLLGSHGVRAAAPKIIPWLTDPDAKTRATAAAILGELRATEASSALIRALGDADDEVRVRAVAALGRLGESDAVIPLIGRLEDEKAPVRQAAVSALAELGDARAVVPLVGLFDDSAIEIRQEAIAAVGSLGDTAAVPALLRLLRDRNVRGAAAAALGRLAAARATPELIADLGSERSDNAYRAVVATSLGHIARGVKAGDDNPAAAALVEALADPHLRKAAREALEIAGRAAVPPLVEHLRGERPGDPEAAVELLRDIGDARATAALVTELGRGRLPRTLVLEALGRSGDEEALVPIIGLLREPDPEVRLAAMKALEPLVQGDARAADVVVDLLKDQDEEMRVLAARYLGIMKATVAVPALVAVVADERAGERFRSAALVALGIIGDRRAADAALAILEAGPQALHRPAATALVMIAPDSARNRLLDLARGRTARDAQAGSRLQALRALAAVLRDHPDAEARKELVRLADKGPPLSALAALDALAAMADPQARAALRRLADHPDPGRRAGALSALGRVAQARDRQRFLDALRSRDDRVAGAGGLALAYAGGELDVDTLVAVARQGGFAAALNASMVLARHLDADDARALRPLLFHKSPAVRANAVFALGRLNVAGARSRLSSMLEADGSWLVRMAAARALSRIGGAEPALQRAVKADPNERVRDEARRALELAFDPEPPTQWRSLHFVDPVSAAPVTLEPYVVVGSDGVSVAVLSDERGEATLEAFPPGQHWVKPADRLAEL